MAYVLNGVSYASKDAAIAALTGQLETANEKLAARTFQPGISFGVNRPRAAGTNGPKDKGAKGGSVHVRGINGRFGVSLYPAQIARLIPNMAALCEFTLANLGDLSVRDEDGGAQAVSENIETLRDKLREVFPREVEGDEPEPEPAS